MQIAHITKDSVAIISNQVGARFPGGANAWAEFLQENLNAKLGRKYIPLPKNEYTATQVVKVSFCGDKSGHVTEVTVDNPNEIQFKLAGRGHPGGEQKPLWEPATLNGRKVYSTKQSIAFT